MSLDEPFEVVGETAADRLRRMEALRRASYAMRGLDYPEGPTPRDERASWPVFVRGE